ncbi:efflux RND transporter periplasmic adaptor subunit [Phaeovulum vinaykumarii]|uniref:Membrane fusion protein, multidrug efflux system n=1 Tax=Phaeovulum vinaykumarii TaxID=407234 RepID=A0A1N7L985_9RHOB|nr:efflux RND transporter periplasmic adaptor subunit [Phaeovulum vinaykumarii]SIS70404.1 membrane fusion protein, multidrug efflux system [Phaeovulum vinaykumarii]SOB98924.1 membrane fusion protein (multidrug efflux system) [Phaeovulum vinaykumarii]
MTLTTTAPACRSERPAAALLLLSLLLPLFLALSGAAAAQEGAPPAKVGVMEMTRAEVAQTTVLPGRAVAFQKVDLRPRVEGVVEDILYTPGRPVKAGDPMFRIDDAAYRAEVAADRSELTKARAALELARSAYARASQLEGSGYTAAEVESARADLAEAEASVEAAEAALDYAQTQLSWTTITSPIHGVPDVAAVSVGDLVTAGQADALTTITRLDPIYVDMIEASARMLSLRSRIAGGELHRSNRLEARLVLENGQVYEGAGELVTPGVSVATSTGTFTARFRFDNPRRMILPGMFVRGEVVVGSVDAFLVPQRAATRAVTGALTVYVVDDTGHARQLSLTESGSSGNAWIVEDGLEEGAQLIVDGLKSLRDGQAVIPELSVIDAEGLVQPAPETPDKAANPDTAATGTKD